MPTPPLTKSNKKARWPSDLKLKLSSAENIDVASNWRDFYADCDRQWRFQADVIEHMSNYIAKASQETSPLAAIVKMPTGTGKTAIMALLVNYTPTVHRALLVVPSEALKDQIRDYVSADHWVKCKKRPREPKIAAIFEPTGLESLIADLEAGRIHLGVCTTQTLGEVHSRHTARYQELKSLVDLIIVDEGHREPAKTWSKAVRELKKPTILFTATPYRNDLRFFRIGTERHEVTYHEAVDHFQCIRAVYFIEGHGTYSSFSLNENRWIPEHLRYLKSLRSAMAQILKDCRIAEPKLIIRCNSAENIALLTRILNEQFDMTEEPFRRFATGQEGHRRPIALGLHDSFGGDKKRHLYKNLSSILNSGPHGNSDRHAIFWIHQFKLTEGIDDPAFIGISFYEPFGNGRSLVQQVGRVIRKPADSLQLKCHVHADPQFELESIWKGYLDYENVDTEGKKRRIYGTEEIVERILQSFPTNFYFSRRFSRVLPFHLNDQQLSQILEADLRIPKSTLIFRGQTSDETITEWLKKLSDWLLDEDVVELISGVRDIKDIWPDCQTPGHFGIYLGFEVRPSDYLQENLFFDISMVACTFLALQGERLVFFRGNSTSWLDEMSDSLEPLASREIQALAETEGSLFSIKQASFVHSDPSPYTKRRRVEGGRDLKQTAPFTDDHLHALTSLVCSREGVQRYLGITRGRITDGQGIFVSAKAYVEWAMEIAFQLKKQPSQSAYFYRFASPEDPPDDYEARYLICDFREFANHEGPIELDGSGLLQEAFEEQELIFDDEQTAESFELARFGPKIKFKLEYQHRRFAVVPKDRENRSILDEEFGEGTAASLRKLLIVRILLDVTRTDGLKTALFYTEGQFFQLSIPLWGRDRIEAIGSIHGLKELEDTEFEKEDFQNYSWPSNPTTWPEKSIFFVADSLCDETYVNQLNRSWKANSQGFEDIFFKPEVLICPDRAGEIADFILYSKTLRKIVLIHAKQASPPRAESAVGFGKLQEQIIKNLRFFDPAGLVEGELEDQFGGTWKNQTKPAGSLAVELPRIRESSGKSAAEIVKDIIYLVRTGASREVWVFYGQGFSCKSFQDQLGQAAPAYWLRHMAYLLVNTNSAVGRAQATLRIFTSV